MTSRFENISILLALTVLVTFMGCENPGDFDRNNRLDPESDIFVPSTKTPGPVNVSTVEINEVRLNWPLYYGVETYRVFRSRENQSNYTIITEITGFSDTTFVDAVPKAGNYYYRIDAVGRNGEVTSIESQRVLSNLIEGPSHSEFGHVATSPSFIHKTSQNTVLIHFLQDFSNLPIYSELDLSTNEWYTIEFQNYSELALPRRLLQSYYFYPINDHEILLFNIFNESDSGWGPWQDFLGIVCNLTTMACKPIGENILQQRYRYENVAFGRITESRILVTGSLSSNYLRVAYLLDLKDYSLTEVPLPLNDKLPSNLSSLSNGNVLACGEMRYNAHPDRYTCQIFDAETNTWSTTAEMPILEDIVTSIMLDDGRVFVISESDDRKAMIYNPDSDTWSVTADSKFASGRNFHVFKGINLYSFRNPILKLANGNVVRYTSYPEVITGLAGRHFLEEYDPKTNEWASFYELPDNIYYIHSITMLDGNSALIIYRAGAVYNNIVRSAVIYF